MVSLYCFHHHSTLLIIIYINPPITGGFFLTVETTFPQYTKPQCNITLILLLIALKIKELIVSTQRVNCPKQVWTQVTNVSKEGTIVLLSAGVILTESTAQPTGDGNDTPRSGNLTQSGAWGSYSKVAASEFVWAYATTGDADLDVTPADGGAL